MAEPDRNCLEKPFLKLRLSQIGGSFKGKSGEGSEYARVEFSLALFPSSSAALIWLPPWHRPHLRDFGAQGLPKSDAKRHFAKYRQNGRGP